MSEPTANDLGRRAFLKRAALTGAAVAWAAPVIQSVSAGPAFAATQGSPPTACFHSNDSDPSQSCMDACTSPGTGCNGEQCDGFGGPPGEKQGPCALLCDIRPGNQCCNVGLCNPANFHCNPGDEAAQYTGPLVGCS
jgi:hypothetical protein